MLARQRIRWALQGKVQGVGLRPNLFRLAHANQFKGLVRNLGDRVEVELEGFGVATEFSRFLEQNPSIEVREHTCLPPLGSAEFEICDSLAELCGPQNYPADRAICADCELELRDPNDRRFGYPFISCTQCGPRYTLIEQLPFDRKRTTFRKHPACQECEAEYRAPSSRRFHAQLISCPQCGPGLWWEHEGEDSVTGRKGALEKAAHEIRLGRIVAVKGVGGFHLFCLASDKRAVEQLRKRKQRPTKPFAVMFPTLDLIEKYVQLNHKEKELLQSPEAPIVLVRRKQRSLDWVWGNSPSLSALLPYSALHHLLLDQVGEPVVATSANRAGDRLICDNRHAIEELRDIADSFLMHDLEIRRPLDDSIIQVIGEKSMLLRRGRGFTGPLWKSPRRFPKAAIALGGHLKAAPAFAQGDFIELSPYQGDLSSESVWDQYETSVNTFRRKAEDAVLVFDPHPHYLSHQWAKKQKNYKQPVYHHVAHLLACTLEHGIVEPALGVAWDGTGFGPTPRPGLSRGNRIWGGEFFLMAGQALHHCFQLRPFPLPGGTQAILDPRRSLLGMLYEMEKSLAFERPIILELFSDQERRMLSTMLSRQAHCPQTSSVGRMFDAVSVLLGFRGKVSYEAEAAMWLQSRAQSSSKRRDLRLRVHTQILDWELVLRRLLASKNTPEDSASDFHWTLANAISSIAQRLECKMVCLAGGVFQNSLLVEHVSEKLGHDGIALNFPENIPPNDEGLSFGQLAAFSSQENNLCV
ncbi:MAG: carbamoyltransferase HypF [Bdellovibrionales bacterium]|nr:carbamoyltransferase HypF [Bdellovibrionales bacterium]